MEIESNNPIQVYVLDENQLKEICKVAGDAGARRYKEEEKQSQKRRADRRLHNTELLLRNYKALQLSVDNAIYTMRQLEEEASTNEILNLMMDRDDDELILQSVRASKAKTILILKHIDNMLRLYRVYSDQQGELDQRRYQVLYDRYIAEPALQIVPDITNKYYISKETAYNDLKIAKERLSTLIFGVDGLPIS